MSMPIFLYNVGHKFYTSAFESGLWFVEMNLETHVFLIPNFLVENKIVGKQKTQVKFKILQLYFPTYKQMHISWITKENHLKFTYIGISPLCFQPSF
jgi:hypothetical protein